MRLVTAQSGFTREQHAFKSNARWSLLIIAILTGAMTGCRTSGWPCSSGGYNYGQVQPFAPAAPQQSLPPASIAPSISPNAPQVRAGPFREVAPPTTGPLINSPPVVPPNLTPPSYNAPFGGTGNSPFGGSGTRPVNPFPGVQGAAATPNILRAPPPFGGGFNTGFGIPY